MRGFSASESEGCFAMSQERRFQVYWDMGYKSGVLPQRFRTRREAERFAERWKHKMVALYHTPHNRREARGYIQWEVREVPLNLIEKPKPDEEQIVLAYAKIARPIILKHLNRRSCIASSRVTIEVLRTFGVTAQPIPCSMQVVMPDLNLMYFNGCTPEKRAEYQKQAARYETLPNDPGGGWNGHVVVEAADLLIDPSFDQALDVFATVDPTVASDPTIMVLPNCGRLLAAGQHSVEAVVLDDRERQLHIRYDPLDDGSFASTPAWELDYLLPTIRNVKIALQQALP